MVSTPSQVDDLAVARRELEAVVEEIRSVPGHHNFLALPTLDDVRQGAADQLTVYVTAVDRAGLALVVDGGDIRDVALPDLTEAAIRDRLLAQSGPYEAVRAGGDPGRWRAALDTTGRWLWDLVVEPLAGDLDGVPAITVVPGGLLGLLPLHAAWTPDEATPTGRRHLLDLCAVSYAPNVRSLISGRALAARVPGRRALVVAEPLPHPPGAAPLPFAAYEGAVVAAAFGTEDCVLLGGVDATTEAVTAELPRADVLHFACHGVGEPGAPLDGALLLAGGRRLRMRDILTLDLRARLAVLSACESAEAGVTLPDEALSLPTALLQAGVAGVVATQWAVPDLASALAMTRFYQEWRAYRARGGGSAPAAALRQALCWLRDTTNAEKAAAVAAAGDLPESVAEAFLDELAVREPDDRAEATVDVWAAFTHTGV